MPNLKKPKIVVNMLGRPITTIDNNQITFPFKQVEAMFYYLLLEGTTSKEKLGDLLWPECLDEERLKSNMRNALYVMRKIFGREIIAEPFKKHIAINPAMNIWVDALKLQKGELKSIVKGELLEDFILKDNEEFTLWTDITRERIRQKYLEDLLLQISESYDGRDFDNCEKLCHQLIKEDEFDERSYKYLIDVYKETKEYAKAINIYTKMEKLFSQELFETPSQEITQVVDQIKKERNREIFQIVSGKNKITPNFEDGVFYGRESELEQIAEEVIRFRQGTKSQSAIIIGEEGVGKTLLANRALSNKAADLNNVIFIKTRCYRAQEGYILKPWESVLVGMMDIVKEQNIQIDSHVLNTLSAFFPFLHGEPVGESSALDDITLKNQNIEKIIMKFLHQITIRSRAILFFDDIQWADEISISLIRNLITQDENNNIMFIFTCRDIIDEYIEQFIDHMKLYKLLTVINLQRFDYEDTIQIAKLLLPEHSFSENVKRQLYKETEGNAFFVIEMLNNIKYNRSLVDLTPNIRDVIKNRIANIDSEGQKIIELLSMFFDGVSFEILSLISNKEEYELLNIMENLITKRLIKEEIYGDSVLFQFTHQKICEYAYNEMSYTKRKFFHEKIAKYYESRLTGQKSDTLIHTKLIYHFDNAGNKQKTLEYAIRYVYNYLNTEHEYFPIIEPEQSPEDYQGNISISIMDIKGIETTLLEISKRVTESLQHAGNGVNTELLGNFYHMMGRYYIRLADYDAGLKYIMPLKQLCQSMEKEKKQEYLIKANRQLICIYINMYDCAKMREIIDESVNELKNSGTMEDLAIWQRLDGLEKIMTGKLSDGEKVLNTAIECFERSPFKEKYIFNLAASYAWLGEAQTKQKNFEQAMEHYTKAVEICAKHNLSGGVCTFYLYAGTSLFFDDKVKEAEYYFRRSIDYYEETDLMWGRGLAYCYSAFLQAIDGNYNKAKQMITMGYKYSTILQSDFEKGVLALICFNIKKQMEKDSKAHDVFSEMLDKDADYYKETAKKLLEDTYTPLEHEYLMGDRDYFVQNTKK